MTLREAKEWLYALARSKKRRLFGIVLFLVAAGFGAYIGTIAPFARISYASLILSLVVPCSLLIVVWLLIKPEHTRNGRVGIVLAIDYETEEEAQLMANDFVREVERDLALSMSAYQFQIIIPNRIFVPLARDRKSAEALRQLCHAHFVLVADIRTRLLNGQNTRALRLDGLVCHAPIPIEASAVLAREMRQVLPPEHRIACDNDLDGFEVTSAFIALASRYVIAIAAMVPQDFEYAISLLTELRSDLPPPNTADLPAITKLRELVPLRLADCYLARSRQLHNLWRNTRDPAVLQMAEDAIDAFNGLRPDDPNYSILKAICCFVLHTDVGSARTFLNRIRAQQKGDPTCLYGLAFLDALEGKMNQAYHRYKQAVSLDSTTPATAFEVEEFIEWYLSTDPSKVQLHYCLGYLNFRRKGDLMRAQKDLEAFLATDASKNFPDQRTAATKWLAEIASTVRTERNASAG